MAIGAADGTGTTATAGADVAGAINRAATRTGTSFQYLVTTAKMESNLDPAAAAPTSSARGLFQFIDQTWLGTVKEAGSYFGYSNYADAISKSDSGSYSVSDPAMRRAIMKLRDDPAASSAMAGVLTQSNSFKLTGAIGRRPTDAELYMAHFMGVSGATKLINAAQATPQVSGAALFPNAAAANRSIFTDSSGNTRSVVQVYDVLNARYAAAANAPSTRAIMASTRGASTTVASAAPTSGAQYLSVFPDLHSVQPAAQTAASSQQPNAPLFRSLYQAGDRAEPVSSVVQQLWGNGVSLTTEAVSAGAAQPNVRAPQRLDLFSDRFGAFSG